MSMVTEQFPVVFVQAFDQPEKVEVELGVGIRLTGEPSGKSAEQFAMGQEMPGGSLVTNPPPAPSRVTYRPAAEADEQMETTIKTVMTEFRTKRGRSGGGKESSLFIKRSP
jgi:hypothetical protein